GETDHGTARWECPRLVVQPTPVELFGFEPFTISSLRLCRRSLTGVRISFNAITLAPAGRDQVVSEFFADAEDVDVNEIGQGVIALVEEMFVERRTRDHLTPV